MFQTFRFNTVVHIHLWNRMIALCTRFKGKIMYVCTLYRVTQNTKNETSETTVRNLHCLFPCFLIFMNPCDLKLVFSFPNLKKNITQKAEILDNRLNLSLFQVIVTVSLFLGSPVCYTVRSSCLKSVRYKIQLPRSQYGTRSSYLDVGTVQDLVAQKSVWHNIQLPRSRYGTRSSCLEVGTVL